MSWEEIKLDISDDVQQILEDRHILVDDIRQVIFHAESEGARLYVPDSDLTLAKHRIGKATVYAKYSRLGDGYVVHTAYAHRAEIK
jgi:glutamate synthase (NADPH/NADH) small chain